MLPSSITSCLVTWLPGCLLAWIPTCASGECAWKLMLDAHDAEKPRCTSEQWTSDICKCPKMIRVIQTITVTCRKLSDRQQWECESCNNWCKLDKLRKTKQYKCLQSEGFKEQKTAQPYYTTLLALSRHCERLLTDDLSLVHAASETRCCRVANQHCSLDGSNVTSIRNLIVLKFAGPLGPWAC